MGAECPYQAPWVPDAHMSAFVLSFETKMSAPDGKQSLAAIITMIPLNTRKEEILTMKMYAWLWFHKRCLQ